MRWSLEDKYYVSNRKFPLDSDFAHAVHGLLDHMTQNIGVAIGIHNFTKSEELNAPGVKLLFGTGVKYPDTRVFANAYGTALFAQSLLAGARGLLSYRIGDTGKKIVVSFDVPITGLTAAHFNVTVMDEFDEMGLSMWFSMNSTAISKGEFNVKVKDYHIRGVIGDPYTQQFVNKKYSLRFELYDCVEYPLPHYTVDLTESVTHRGHNNSFWMHSPLFEKKEFFLDKSSTVLDGWVSVIQANRKVGDQHEHQYQSFVPMRTPCAGRFFIGGKEYYDDLLVHLKAAKTEILITGWFISPQVHLTREKVKGKYVDRLDEVLLERARAGIQVYILVWDEIDAAFRLGSKTVYEFIAKHENVHVIRDPLDILGLWSHHQKTVIIDQLYGYCGGIDLAYNRYDTHEYTLTDEENDQIFPGRDYVNPMVSPSGPGNIGNPYEDVWKRCEQPRMPWQDLHCKVIGEPARDLARNFIQRWNRSRSTGVSLSLRPSDFSDIHGEDHKVLLEAMSHEPYQNLKVQIVRSACHWSLGLSTIENSIYQAQVDAIKNSQHMVYVENQFFLSSYEQYQSNPQNKLLRAIVQRLSKAIENKEQFRFIFVTPIHSSSPLKNKTAQQLTYWQLATMFHGEKSLFGGLRKKYPDVDIEKYITISCLRQWGKFKSGVYCTEMIYVHAKLMIVDDKIVFISSANVNDRSMMGDRDSEIGARIEDNDMIESTMGGQKWKASKYAHDLRCRLQGMWTGAAPGSTLAEEIKDPVTFYDKWIQIARDNRDIFVDVFQKTEDNIKHTFDIHYLTEFGHYLKARNTEKLKNLQGKVVPYPSDLFRSSYSAPNENDPTSTFYC
jgi:phosphatidylserine/phosphatidylglycerophosphate/cardiolipin synthase-like enzyme